MQSATATEDYGDDPKVVVRRLLVRLQEGDERVFSNLLGNLTELSEFQVEVVALVFPQAPPPIVIKYLSILQAAYLRKIMAHDPLAYKLCHQDAVTGVELRAACAQTRPKEPPAPRLRQSRGEPLDRIGLRSGLTVMSLALAGLQMGLTIPFREQTAGQGMTVVSGLIAGSFVFVDFGLMPPSNLYQAMVLYGIPAGAMAGGGIAYTESRHPISTAVFTSVNTAITLICALTLTWSSKRCRGLPVKNCWALDVYNLAGKTANARPTHSIYRYGFAGHGQGEAVQALRPNVHRLRLTNGDTKCSK